MKRHQTTSNLKKTVCGTRLYNKFKIFWYRIYFGYFVFRMFYYTESLFPKCTDQFRSTDLGWVFFWYFDTYWYFLLSKGINTFFCDTKCQYLSMLIDIYQYLSTFIDTYQHLLILIKNYWYLSILSDTYLSIFINLISIDSYINNYWYISTDKRYWYKYIDKYL